MSGCDSGDFDLDELVQTLLTTPPDVLRRSRVPRPQNVPEPAWWAPDAPHVRFGDHDLAVFNHSGGKDGAMALWRGYQQAIDEGFPTDRIIVHYNRLGGRVSWPGTAQMGPNAELLVARYGDRPGSEGTARAHAEQLGLRFEVTEREHELDGDLLDQIDRYGKFPSISRRFCTADWKRGPGRKLITRLVKELGLGRQAKVLYVFGFRAQESSRRGKLPVLHVNDAASSGVRLVTEWYPVHHWTEDQIWATTHSSATPYCWPYDAGMRRLSCRFCVLAGGDDLALAAALSPDVAAEYAAVERRCVARGKADGDMRSRTFQEHRSMDDIIAAAEHIEI